MKKRKDRIVIRTAIISTCYFLLISIVMFSLYFSYEKYKTHITLLLGVLHSCMAIMSYMTKIIIYLEKIDQDIIIIDNGFHKKNLAMGHIKYKKYSNFMILTDGKNDVNLEKNRKVLRELKKLGALEKEL